MTSYDLKSISVPRLVGDGLDIVAALVENTVTRGRVIAKFLKDAGVSRFRTCEVDRPPTNTPLDRSHGPTAEVWSPARAAALRIPEVEAGGQSSVAHIARRLKDGRMSPVELATRTLAAIRASDEAPRPLRAFVSIDEADVLAQARASEDRLRRGEARSILEGVPVAVKDELDQLGHGTTVGTSFLGRDAARSDATSVARLRALGAVLVGKTNMHEIGINPTGLNVFHGSVRNPHDPDKDSGGSSSGSAAAVAAGLCPLALGADGGGSIRIPAAICGVVGLKATYGRISEHGAAPLCWSVAHVGPIGSTVFDVALGYLAVAGPDPSDPGTMFQPPPSIEGWNEGSLRGLRVGVFRPWFQHASPAIVSACTRGLSALTAAGALLTEVEIPDLDAIRVAHAITILSEMATSMTPFADSLGDMAASTRVSLAFGRSFTALDYVKAQRIRSKALADMDEVLRGVDLIATPTTAITAPDIPTGIKHEAWSDLSATTELMRFAFLTNFTGHPAISVPVGVDSERLPIGLQLIARHWEEHLLFRAARIVERETAWIRPRRFQAVLGE